MNRRTLLEACCIAMAGIGAAPAFAQAPAAHAGAADLPTLAVVDFELVDDQNNPLTKAAQEVRLRQATTQLGRELGEAKLYRIVDAAPSAGLQRELRSRQEFLYRCDDCAAQIGQLLGVDLVMVCWVQKVSELILNLNVQVFDVKAGKPIFSKSVDMRGNTDQSWTRAVHYLVRDMAEKRALDSRYGR